jgi:hypothetical protein
MTCLTYLREHDASDFNPGKDSFMYALPPLDISALLDDQDWIENITILRGDFELSQMSPLRDYGSMVRWASRELDLALHTHRPESLRQHEAKAGVLK